MSANTKIEWADHTFNPWIGCTKVGPGCDNCYAKAQFDDRRHRAVWGAGRARIHTSVANWNLPFRWNKQHEAFFDKHGHRQRVFCASLSDVFDNEAPPSWRIDLLRLIAGTPNLDWLLLTKRIGNAHQMMTSAFQSGWPAHGTMWTRWGELFRNVWIGATICNQTEADRDIPKLLAVPAAKRFLSMEPLLGPVDLAGMETGDGYVDPLTAWSAEEMTAMWGEPMEAHPRIDWVIVGGESGPNARPMHPDWVRSLRDQCQAAGVPFLFKQWGEWTPGENVERVRGTIDTAFLCCDGWRIYPFNLATDGGHVDDQPDLYQVGKKAAGRHLDGITWDEVPA